MAKAIWGTIFSPNDSQRLHCLDRSPATKLFGGGERDGISEHLFSQAQHHIVTGWKTITDNGDFCDNDTPGLEVGVSDY